MEANHPTTPQEEIAALNDRYYSASPDAYFATRISSLLVTASQLPAWSERLAEGIDVGPATIGVGPDEHIEHHVDEAQLAAHVTAETEITLYHLIETVFAHYLAHADFPDCPLVGLMYRKSQKEFRDEVERRILKPASEVAMRAEVSEVCLRRSQVDMARHTIEQIEAGVDNLISLLQFMARHLVESADVYNAAKHGLTASPNEMYLGFIDVDGAPLFSVTGPSLEYLTVGKWEDGYREWKTHIEWINLAAWWAFTYAGVEILKSIWTVGRIATYGATGNEFAWLPEGLRTSIIIEATGGFSTQRWSRSMFFEKKGTLRPRRPPDQTGS